MGINNLDQDRVKEAAAHIREIIKKRYVNTRESSEAWVTVATLHNIFEYSMPHSMWEYEEIKAACEFLVSLGTLRDALLKFPDSDDEGDIVYVWNKELIVFPKPDWAKEYYYSEWG